MRTRERLSITEVLTRRRKELEEEFDSKVYAAKRNTLQTSVPTKVDLTHPIEEYTRVLAGPRTYVWSAGMRKRGSTKPHRILESHLNGIRALVPVDLRFVITERSVFYIRGHAYIDRTTEPVELWIKPGAEPVFGERILPSRTIQLDY